MCLNPKYIVNKHYCGTIKNNYEAPELTDVRKKYVQIPCGFCLECKKQIRRDWTIRCEQEHKWNPLETTAWTPSFSEEALDKLEAETGEKDANIIARKAMTQWRKRIWKAWKNGEIDVKHIKHMFVTEIGGHNTERLHLHGMIWADAKTQRWFKQDWEKHYGDCKKGKWNGHETVTYVVKYITKADKEHPGYKSITLVSPGLGKEYINSKEAKNHEYKGKYTKRYYQNEQGYKMSLPRYYHNKIWTEEQRDEMWTMILDKNTNKIKEKEYRMWIPEEAEDYWVRLKTRSQANYRMGYIKYDKKVTYNSRNGVKSMTAYKYDSAKGDYSKRYKKIRGAKPLAWAKIEQKIDETRAIFESITGGTQHSLNRLIEAHNSHKINKVTCTHIDQGEETAFWEKAGEKIVSKKYDENWGFYDKETGELLENENENWEKFAKCIKNNIEIDEFKKNSINFSALDSIYIKFEINEAKNNRINKIIAWKTEKSKMKKL